MTLLVNFFSPCLLFSLSHLLYLAFLFYLVSVLAFSSLLTLFCLSLLVSSRLISALHVLICLLIVESLLCSALLKSFSYLLWLVFKKHCHFTCSLVFICSFLAFILSSIFSSFSSLFSYSHSLLLSLWIFFLIWSVSSTFSFVWCLFILFPPCSSCLSLFATFLSFASNPISCSSSCLLFCPISFFILSVAYVSNFTVSSTCLHLFFCSLVSYLVLLSSYVLFYSIFIISVFCCSVCTGECWDCLMLYWGVSSENNC